MKKHMNPHIFSAQPVQPMTDYSETLQFLIWQAHIHFINIFISFFWLQPVILYFQVCIIDLYVTYVF